MFLHLRIAHILLIFWVLTHPNAILLTAIISINLSQQNVFNQQNRFLITTESNKSKCPTMLSILNINTDDFGIKF